MKTIIFDFDGVIHDTYELAYEIFGKGLTEEKFKDFLNGNFLEIKVSDEVKVIDEKSYELQAEAFKYLKIDKVIKKNLEKLAETHSLFIVSSNREGALNTYFQNNNLLHIFKEILGAESHLSKVEKFKYLFAKYAPKPEDCIFVTDTLGDILEANKVGLKTVAVDFGFHERERLEKGNPFKIVSSFDEVLNVIENS
jgi:phosphoglycolate phosphatase